MEHLSYSQLEVFHSCTMKYYFSYIKKIQRVKRSSYAKLGQAFHKGIEVLYSNNDVETAIKQALHNLTHKLNKTFMTEYELDNLELDTYILQAMIKKYHSTLYVKDKVLNTKVLMAEKELSATIDNSKYEYVYVPDMITQDDTGIWIIDLKTKSQVTSAWVNSLEINNQGIGMIYFVEKLIGKQVAGVKYRVIKKPTIRRKKTEEIGEFISRAELWYDEKTEEKLFDIKVNRKQSFLDDFEIELDRNIKLLDYVKDNNLYAKSTSACSGMYSCEFLGICKGTADIEEYEPKHREEGIIDEL